MLGVFILTQQVGGGQESRPGLSQGQVVPSLRVAGRPRAVNGLPQARAGFLSTFIKLLPAGHWLCPWPEGARGLMGGQSQHLPICAQRERDSEATSG